MTLEKKVKEKEVGEAKKENNDKKMEKKKGNNNNDIYYDYTPSRAHPDTKHVHDRKPGISSSVV